MGIGREPEEWDYCEKCNAKVFNLTTICKACDENPPDINIDNYTDFIDRIISDLRCNKKWLK